MCKGRLALTGSMISHDDEPKADPQGSGALSLSLQHLGFGLYWAWVWLAIFSSTLFSPPLHVLQDLNAVRLAGITAQALALLLAALFAPRLLEPRGHRLLLLGSCVLGPVGTVAIVAGNSLTGVSWLLVSLAGWIVWGLAGACMIWLWGKYYASIDVRSASIYMSASVALGALVYFVITYMQPAAALAATSVLPLVSAGMVLLAGRGSSQAALAGTAVDQRHFPAILSRVLWGIAIYAVAFGLLKGMSLPEYGRVFDYANRLSLLGSGIMGLLIAASVVVASRFRTPGLMYRLVLPTMVAGFLLLSFLGTDGGMLSTAIVMSGFTCFDILTWIVLFEVAHRLGFSPVRVFGFGRFANVAGLCVGWAIGLLFMGGAHPEQPILTALSLGAVFLLVLTTMLVLDEPEIPIPGIPANSSADSSAQGAHDDLGSDVTFGPWRRRCTEIARTYGLSPREEEVLILLAKGRDTEFIQNALVITDHTARAHTYHIYKKLNIHSRQELLDVIEGLERTPKR